MSKDSSAAHYVGFSTCCNNIVKYCTKLDLNLSTEIKGWLVNFKDDFRKTLWDMTIMSLYASPPVLFLQEKFGHTKEGSNECIKFPERAFRKGSRTPDDIRNPDLKVVLIFCSFFFLNYWQSLIMCIKSEYEMYFKENLWANISKKIRELKSDDPYISREEILKYIQRGAKFDESIDSQLAADEVPYPLNQFDESVDLQFEADKPNCHLIQFKESFLAKTELFSLFKKYIVSEDQDFNEEIFWQHASMLILKGAFLQDIFINKVLGDVIKDNNDVLLSSSQVSDSNKHYKNRMALLILEVETEINLIYIFKLEEIFDQKTQELLELIATNKEISDALIKYYERQQELKTQYSILKEKNPAAIENLKSTTLIVEIMQDQRESPSSEKKNIRIFESQDEHYKQDLLKDIKKARNNTLWYCYYDMAKQDFSEDVVAELNQITCQLTDIGKNDEHIDSLTLTRIKLLQKQIIRIYSENDKDPPNFKRSDIINLQNESFLEFMISQNQNMKSVQGKRLLALEEDITYKDLMINNHQYYVKHFNKLSEGLETIINDINSHL